MFKSRQIGSKFWIIVFSSLNLVRLLKVGSCCLEEVQVCDIVTCVWQCDLCVTLWPVCDNVTCVWHCDLCVTLWPVCDIVTCVWHCDLCVTLWPGCDTVTCVVVLPLCAVLYCMLPSRKVFPPDVIWVHCQEDIETLLYVYCRSQAEAKPGTVH